MPKTSSRPYVACLAAALALAVAMGVGRFAFTPMLPLMIRDGGVTLEAGHWIAAVNYFGYLVGALSARVLPFPSQIFARASLVGVVLATLAMGASGGLAPWLALRGVAGVLSGWALVGVSTWALAELAAAGRPRLAGLVYSGVGVGIAGAGLFCMVAATPGVSAARLWAELAALALVATLPPLLLMRGGQAPAAAGVQRKSAPAPGLELMTFCYGAFGFGYILPATYLPALARQMLDDPRAFGLVWPIFGAAAACSTLFAGASWIQANRLRAWAVCHAVMALGAALPSLWLSLPALAGSAVLIGGTFMIVTMLGLQEARSRSPDNAPAALGQMTAAFALGQLAGPLALVAAPAGSLNLGLRVAALGLLASASALWWLSGQKRTFA